MNLNFNLSHLNHRRREFKMEFSIDQSIDHNILDRNEPICRYFSTASTFTTKQIQLFRCPLRQFSRADCVFISNELKYLTFCKFAAGERTVQESPFIYVENVCLFE